MCLVFAPVGCTLELMALMALNIGNIQDWFIEGIDWGFPIIAQLVYHPICKLPSIVLLSLTEPFNSIITIGTLNDTSLPGGNGQRVLRISIFSVCYLSVMLLLRYVLCLLVLLWAKNFSSFSFEVLDCGSGFRCPRLEGCSAGLGVGRCAVPFFQRDCV